MGEERVRVRAEGSGPHPVSGEADEQHKCREAEEHLARQEWSAARELWHQLACASPPNKHYRTQLMFARAGELFESGQLERAREELDRVLRVAPSHEGAQQMVSWIRRRSGRISRWLLTR